MPRSPEIQQALDAVRLAPYPGQIRALVEAASREQLAFQPEPGEWSIVEILRHLGDTEELRQMRFDRLLAEDNPYLERVPPTPGERDADDALQLLARWERLRERAIKRLGGLTDDQWRRSGVQGPDPQVNRVAPEPTSILKESGKISLHASRHLEQIQKNLAAFAAGRSEPR